MKIFRSMLAILLLFATLPARADFKYTETSQITGGALIKVVKFASVFARGDAKKQEREMLQPTTTTHYLKGNRLRTDRTDGTAQIIDLEGRRVISIDTKKMTYAVATFDQIRDAMQQAQQKMQQEIAQKQQPGAPPPDAKVTVTPTIHITPGVGTRVILDQPTKENKMTMDLTMQATATGASAPPPGQPNSATATYTMNVDTFVAPGVTGYLEFGQFYRRMAKEVSWMTLPSNIQVDPRVSVAMSSLQQNADAFKGFPLLSYTSMTIVAAGTDPSQAATTAQTQQAPPPPPPSNTSSGSGFPDSPSAAMVKGLGGLFGKKKKQDDSAAQPAQDGSSSQTAAPPPNPNSDPNALMEMTTQVTSFSESSLDGGLFDVPAGYTLVQLDPTQVLGGVGSSQSQTTAPSGKR